MKLRRLNTKTYAKEFRKQQDYWIPVIYRMVKSELNAQLLYVNKVLLDTKSIGLTIARIDKNTITVDTVKLLNDIHAKVGMGINTWLKKYIDYEQKAVDIEFLNSYFDGLIYQLSQRGSQIADTSINSLTNILHKAAEEGLSISATSRLLKSEFNRLSTTRATRIARTEVISASNRGSVKTVEGLGNEFDIEFKKVWLATGGGRTRSSHSAASGQTVNMNENFNVNGESLEYPGDVNGSAGNIINCRCTTIYDS